MDEHTQALHRLVARYLDHLLNEQTELQMAHLDEPSAAAEERKTRLDEILQEIEACRLALAQPSPPT